MKTLASRRFSPRFIFGLLLRGAAAAAGHLGSSRSARPRRRGHASRAKWTLALLALALLSADASFCMSGLAAPSSDDPVVDPWPATAQQPLASRRERWEALFGSADFLPGPSAARVATEPDQGSFGQSWNPAPAAPAGQSAWFAPAPSAGTARGAFATRSSPGPIGPVTNTPYTVTGDYNIDPVDYPSNTLTSIGAGDTFTIGGSLRVGFNHTASFSESGGSVTAQASGDNDGFVLGYGAGSNGTYTLTGGTLSAVNAYVGENGSGAMNHSAGTASFSGTLYVAAATGSNGTYNLSGTGSLSAFVENIGFYSGGSGHFVQSGGTNTTHSLFLSQYPDGQGTYRLSGGTLTASEGISVDNGTFTQTGGSITTSLLYLANGAAGDVGAYVMSGGTLTIQPVNGSNSFAIGTDGVGTFTQTGGTITNLGNSYSNNLIVGLRSGRGTYNLDGGTLNVYGVMGLNSLGTFNFNGGTLQTTADNGSFMLNLTTANVRNGGAKIDTNGHDVTISQTLVHSTVSGDNATDGGLTKLGSGTLTLSGANTYNGGTRINAGTLLFPRTNSMPATGTVAVASGATLAVNAGGTGEFTNATSGAGSLGGLLAGVGGQGAPVSFASGASVGIDTTNAANGGLTYSGVIADPNNGANALGFAKLGGRTLTLTGANTYTGGTMVNGGTLAVSGSGTLGAASGTLGVNGGTLDLGGKSLSVGAVTLTSSTIQNGTLTGTSYNGQSGTVSASLAGNSGLTKTTAGTLTLSGTNTYTGSTTVSAGTLAISGGSTGSLNAPLSVTGPASNNALVSLSEGTLLASSEVLGFRGSGTFRQTFGTSTNTVAGTLYLGFFSSDTGTYILGGGTLQAAQVTGASATSVFNFQGGTLRAGASDNPADPNNPTTFFGGAFTANVRNAPSSIDTNGFNVTIASNLLHSTIAGDYDIDGGLVKIGAGTLTLTGNNTYNGGTTVSAGTLQGNTASLQGNIQDNANLVFDQAADGTFTGVISGAGTLTKTGAGTLTLTGANTYNGGTVVQAGTLLVTNASGSGTGSGQVTVGNAAVLGGSGTIGGNVVAQAGSIVAPGAASKLATARLTLGGTLTLQTNALLAIKLGGTTGGSGFDQVFAQGGFALAGNLQVSLVNGFVPTLNQSFTILDNTGNSLNSGFFANVPTGIYTTADGLQFFVNYAGYVDGGLFPNDVTLTYIGANVVPEPGTWAWLLVGVGALVVRHARRREHAGQA